MKVNPLKRNDKSDRLAGGVGNIAAKSTNEANLRRVVLANLLWENNFYINGAEVTTEIDRLVPLVEPIKVYNIALEARLQQKLRHTPLYLAVQMLKYPEHKKLVGDLLPKIITRADQITDFVAIYEKVNGHVKPLAKQAKIGLAESFKNFDEYQYAKYNRKTKITFRDVMRLVRPKPNPGNEMLYERIMKNTLRTPDTWEVALSAGKDKKETWERLIIEGKIGGLAMLRNIRNMTEARVSSDIIKLGLEKLANRMLLPLDFFKAYKINPQYQEDIEKAMMASYQNLPKLPGKTLFVLDVSGSMRARLSSKSDFTRMDMGAALAILAINQCEKCDLVCTAGSDMNRIQSSKLIENPEKGFSLIDQIQNAYNALGGGGIFTRQCLEWCKDNVGVDYDRIIIFSDSQDTDKNKKPPQPFGNCNYIIDISSEKRGINYKGVFTAEITGRSEHFLTYISSYEGLEINSEEE